MKAKNRIREPGWSAQSEEIAQDEQTDREADQAQQARGAFSRAFKKIVGVPPSAWRQRGPSATV